MYQAQIDLLKDLFAIFKKFNNPLNLFYCYKNGSHWTILCTPNLNVYFNLTYKID